MDDRRCLARARRSFLSSARARASSSFWSFVTESFCAVLKVSSPTTSHIVPSTWSFALQIRRMRSMRHFTSDWTLAAREARRASAFFSSFSTLLRFRRPPSARASKPRLRNSVAVVAVVVAAVGSCFGDSTPAFSSSAVSIAASKSRAHFRVVASLAYRCRAKAMTFRQAASSKSNSLVTVFRHPVMPMTPYIFFTMAAKWGLSSSSRTRVGARASSTSFFDDPEPPEPPEPAGAAEPPTRGFFFEAYWGCHSPLAWFSL
mmetsp:Transcript_16557/g.53922  ORF Transcript_16557/g.53922 Transcript_16557/m.53922 type:complete len:260 (-) Transcript_16557:1623-2402(-)